MNNNCTGARGRAQAGFPKKNASSIASTISITSAEFAANKYLTKFFMFAKILLPSLTAETIVAKLSSRTIISADSLLTSVPVIPIATPISAFFSAGASFIPSPVIATTFPFFCNALTILNLCSGFTRAKTLIFSIFSSSSCSLIDSSSFPVIAMLPGFIIPSVFATAIAVSRWSPVIIFTSIPAFWHNLIASMASGLGASIIAAIPKKTSSDSASALFPRLFSSEKRLFIAKPKTL